MSAGIFRQQVNLVVSIFFIGSFGLFMTFTVLDLAHIEKPIVGSVSQSIEIGF